MIQQVPVADLWVVVTDTPSEKRKLPMQNVNLDKKKWIYLNTCSINNKSLIKVMLNVFNEKMQNFVSQWYSLFQRIILKGNITKPILKN